MEFAATYRRNALWFLVVLTLLVAGMMLMPLLGALLWAIVLSVLTSPVYRRIRTRLEKIPILAKKDRHENVASLLVTLGTLLIICIPFVLVGLGIFMQVGGMSQDIAQGSLSPEALVAQLDTAVKPITDRLGVSDFSLVEYVQSNREEIANALRAPIGKFAGQAAFTAFILVIALLSQFFLLRDGHQMKEPALRLLPLPRERSLELLHRVSETVHAVFVGTVLVAILQGALIGATYALVGVPNALLLGVISAVLCIVPFLGAPIIYIPVALMLLFQGKTTPALIILGVGFLIVSNVDNVIKPFLIGGRANLHPVAIFFSVLGGIALFGAIGVMAGPMLLTILLLLLEVVQDQADPQVAKIETP